MRIITFLFLLLPVFVTAQDKLLKGRVDTGSLLSEIVVANLNKEIETKIDPFGRFEIKASVGDLLILTSTKIYKKRHLVEETDFDTELIIQVEPLPIEIQVVEINAYSHITAESLGIIPKGQKKLTQAERKLFTATDLNASLNAGTLAGGSLSLDPLINMLTGRTKMLKKVYEMEVEDKCVARLSNTFNLEFFEKTLQIEPHKIDEFKYYAVYSITKNAKMGNRVDYFKGIKKGDLEIRLIKLAEQYLNEK